MEVFISYIQQVDFPTLIVMGIMLWFFKSRMDIKIDKLESSLRSDLNSLREDMKDIDRRLNEIDRRLVAVETTLRIQGACALKEGKVLEKAE